jgi:hypothetical protein
MLVRLQGVEAHHEQLSYFFAQTLLHAATPPVFIVTTTYVFWHRGGASWRSPEKLPWFCTCFGIVLDLDICASGY